MPPEEADEQRERLLAGFRWILVDEYQDIGPDQYELISALAGRTISDEDGRLSLFAVGDDDQNIYAFDGASVEFIRRFEKDYSARPVFLTENYRSTSHIISAANLIIAPAANRMKVEHPISIDRARRKSSPGGEWQQIDRVSQGRVQILPVGNDAFTQAVAVMAEFKRLSALTKAWDWSGAAVIAKEWKFLEPIRSYCEKEGIPVQMADDDAIPFWRLRETQALVEWLRNREVRLVNTAAILEWLDSRSPGPWWELLREAVDTYALETSGAELPIGHILEWMAEWGREVRRRQTGLLLLTAHRAKGLEFDHVAVLDGAWQKVGTNEDVNAPRRLYYVAMTRARKTLLLAQFDSEHAFLSQLSEANSILRRASVDLPVPSPELRRHYQRLTLRDVDMGFAGRFSSGHSVHRSIAKLVANDPLQLLRTNEDRWEITDQHGDTVGRLSRAFHPPADMQCLSVKVTAIIVRRREDSEPEYQDHFRCDQWELAIPELVFMPNN